MNKQKIKINNNVLYKSKIFEVRGDVIVPDIKPDIVKIINSNGNAYIYKKELTTGRIRIDGNIDIRVIYLADNGDTRSIQTTLNFIENIDDSNIAEDMMYDYNLKIVNIEAKILNERKISIISNIEVNGILKKIEEIEIIDDISEIKDVERLEDNVNVMNFVGLNSSKTTLKENIKINENDEIAEILKIDIDILNPETKISYNKVLAKAETEVKIMYLTEDDRINVVTENFPVMSFIDFENIKEEQDCKIDYKIKNMLVTQNSKEQHTILVQVEFDVSCEIFEKRNLSIIKDIYGTKNNIKCKKCLKNLNICTDANDTNKINLEEKVFIEDISKIINVECNPRILERKEANNMINYQGEVSTIILYEVENKTGLCSKEIKIPFVFKKEKNTQIDIRIKNKEVSLSNENVNIQIQLEEIEMLQKVKQLELIEEINIEEDNNEETYSMIVYFVKPEDTLWNIGKRFKVSVEQICKYNNIENSNIIPGNKLYIIR